MKYEGLDQRPLGVIQAGEVAVANGVRGGHVQDHRHRCPRANTLYRAVGNGVGQLAVAIRILAIGCFCGRYIALQNILERIQEGKVNGIRFF